MSKKNLADVANVVKHFRWLAEFWRAHARTLRKEAKAVLADGAPDGPARYREKIVTARTYEIVGRQLKELASDVLNNRTGAI